MNAKECLNEYLVYHDVRPSTAAFYKRCVTVWVRSNGERIDSRKLSEWLGDLKAQGKSDYYRRSLKNGLQALIRASGDEGKIRPIRCEPLDHKFWSAEDVRRLIDAAKDDWWKSLIAAGWCTGFSQIDLVDRLRRDQIRHDGVVVTRRSKTGKLVVGQLEDWVLEILPGTDPVWKWGKSWEMFRKRFRNFVWKARLQGSFKTLRRSAAASVEAAHREQAHRFLGNTRQVCERHYLPASLLVGDALRPESLRRSG